MSTPATATDAPKTPPEPKRQGLPLMAQIMGLVVACVLLSQAASVAIVMLFPPRPVFDLTFNSAVVSLKRAHSAVSAAPRDKQARVATAQSDGKLRFELTDKPPNGPRDGLSWHLRKLFARELGASVKDVVVVSREGVFPVVAGRGTYMASVEIHGRLGHPGHEHAGPRPAAPAAFPAPPRPPEPPVPPENAKVWPLPLPGSDRKVLILSDQDSGRPMIVPLPPPPPEHRIGRELLPPDPAESAMRLKMRERIVPFGAAKLAWRVGDRWLVARLSKDPFEAVWTRVMLTSVLLAILALLPIGWLFARRLSAPIRQFATAADQLGRDFNAPPLPNEGPAELRRASSAFNLMQTRLQRFIADRTMMLAAISHDLRTPLARARFRIETLEDDVRLPLSRDLDEMNDMLSATLAFLRDQAAQSPREKVRLDMILSEIVSQRAQQGGNVTAPQTFPEIIALIDVMAVRRALNNLIDNALLYGGGAEIRLARTNELIVIDILDKGPGIPADQKDQLFEPFRRGDPSRNRSTGGIGLGLTIARAIARSHGGDVDLLPRPDQPGTIARFALPA